MVAVPFPPVEPTSRSYKPGSYPYEDFKALNGTTTRILYGNRRTDAELSLEFANKPDSDAVLILQHYEQITPAGDWASFTTEDGAAGASPSLAEYLKESGGSGLHWRYEGSPEVTSVTPGVSTVRIKMTGQLDSSPLPMSIADTPAPPEEPPPGGGGGGGGGGTWTPAELSPTGWWDASNPSDFILDSGAVTRWNDKSGNNRHMAQTAAPNKPLYGAATQNGLNLVTFNGTSSYLYGALGEAGFAIELNNYFTASAFTVLAVFRARSFSVGSVNSYANRAILCDENGYFGIHTQAPSGIGSAQVLCYNWDGTDDSVTQLIGGNNLWSIVVFTHGGGSIGANRNGNTPAAAASGNTEDLTGGLEFGRNFTSLLFQEMDLAEVVTCNYEVTSLNQQKLAGYAAHRWGLAGDLPGGHPYKSTAP